MSWMGQICDDMNPGLETQENENENTPILDQEIPLHDTDMPPPFSLVPLAPPPPPPRASSQT